MTPNSDVPTVSVIIPVYNGRNFIKRCLESVVQTRYPKFEIIVVDDASTDGSYDIIKRIYGNDPKITIIRNSTNLGAAMTRNVGIAFSKGEVVVVLDDDTKVEPNWLDELVNVLSDPGVGAAQSKMVSFSGDKVTCAGEKVIPYLGWPIILGFSITRDEYRESMNILASSGALAFKREVGKKVGYFDPKFASMHFEDIDFSWRIWITGLRVVLAPSSLVHHEGGRRPLSLNKYRFASYAVQRNCIRFLAKNWGIISLIKYMPTSILGMGFRGLYHMIKNCDPYPLIGLFKAIMWNIVNLQDLLQNRRVVQRFLRKVPDDFIFRKVGVYISPLQVYERYLRTGRV